MCPFVNVGGIFASHIGNNNVVTQRTISGSLIETFELTDPKILHDAYLGYVLGSGLIYDLNYKHALFLDIQYFRAGPLGANLSVARQGFSAFLGYSF